MKYLPHILTTLLALAGPTFALPLQKGLVPADAKWLIHLDLDALRESKIGGAVITNALSEPLAQLKTQFKVDGQFILQKLHSVTAFGNDFMAGSKANGVLLFSGEEDVQRIVEGFLAAQILQNTNGPIQKLQQEPFAIYSLHDQIFLAPRVGGQIVVSKSRQQLEEVKEFLAGRAKGASRGEAFPGFVHVPNTFFFLAAAEGFNDNPAIPPQAKILKMADAARIVLGEKGESIFLNLALKAKDPEVIQQIGQVLEGMKALVALGQSENKELLELVQSTKVATADKTVTVNIEYPLSKVMSKLDGVSQHLQDALNDSTHGRPGKHKSRKSKKADSPEAEE